MKVSDLTKIDCESEDRVVIRVFINGQYMTTCKTVDVYRAGPDKALVFDADLEVFEMEKK